MENNVKMNIAEAAERLAKFLIDTYDTGVHVAVEMPARYSEVKQVEFTVFTDLNRGYDFLHDLQPVVDGSDKVRYMKASIEITAEITAPETESFEAEGYETGPARSPMILTDATKPDGEDHF